MEKLIVEYLKQNARCWYKNKFDARDLSLFDLSEFFPVEVLDVAFAAFSGSNEEFVVLAKDAFELALKEEEGND